MKKLISAICLCGLFGFNSTADAKKKTVPVPKCEQNALLRSKCMISTVLADIMATYKHVGGGGITEIRSTETDVYRVSISQEERVDIITYNLEVKPNGKVHILKKTESTETMGKDQK